MHFIEKRGGRMATPTRSQRICDLARVSTASHARWSSDTIRGLLVDELSYEEDRHVYVGIL